VRSRTLNLIGLFSTHLIQGEPEQACRVGDRALTLATRVRSARVSKRLRETASTAVRDYRDVPAVREFHDKLVTSLPAEPIGTA
jgi:hypothetical protein